MVIKEILPESGFYTDTIYLTEQQASEILGIGKYTRICVVDKEPTITIQTSCILQEIF